MAATLWVAADIGNSAIKLMAQEGEPESGPDVISSEAAQRTVSLGQPDWQEEVIDWVETRRARLAPDAAACWWISTVNRSASDPLRNAWQDTAARDERPFQWHQFAFGEIPMGVAVDAPERLGIDRLVGAYAAARRHAGPLVVVDIGSAVTVDWVHSEPGETTPSLQEDALVGTFYGGAIFPGIRLQTAALSSGTEGLRQPACSGFPSLDDRLLKTLPPGRNTADAIQVGVIAAVAGAIERLANDYPNQRGGDGSATQPTVVVSGGDGALISNHLQIPHVQIPQLVCRGLLDLAVKRCRNTAGGLK